MLSPRELAHVYDRYIAARRQRRTGDVQGFTDWLESHWFMDSLEEPAECPDAVSFLGGAGSGGSVRWYVRGSTIVGVVPGFTKGCYQIPVKTIVPVITDNYVPDPEDRTAWAGQDVTETELLIAKGFASDKPIFSQATTMD